VHHQPEHLCYRLCKQEGHPKKSDQRLRQIGQHDRHPGAGAQSLPAQIRGHDPGQTIEFRIGHGPVLKDYGLAVRKILGRVGQKINYGEGLGFEVQRSVGTVEFRPWLGRLYHATTSLFLRWEKRHNSTPRRCMAEAAPARWPGHTCHHPLADTE